MNHLDILKNIKDFKAKGEAVLKQIEELTAVGRVASDLVKVEIDGKFNVKAIKLDETLLKTMSKDEIEVLLKTAFNDASSKIREEIKSKAGSFTNLGAMF